MTHRPVERSLDLSLSVHHDHRHLPHCAAAVQIESHSGAIVQDEPPAVSDECDAGTKERHQLHCTVELEGEGRRGSSTLLCFFYGPTTNEGTKPLIDGTIYLVCRGGDEETKWFLGMASREEW